MICWRPSGRSKKPFRVNVVFFRFCFHQLFFHRYFIVLWLSVTLFTCMNLRQYHHCAANDVLCEGKSWSTEPTSTNYSVLLDFSQSMTLGRKGRWLNLRPTIGRGHSKTVVFVRWNKAMRSTKTEVSGLQSSDLDRWIAAVSGNIKLLC